MEELPAWEWYCTHSSIFILMVFRHCTFAQMNLTNNPAAVAPTAAHLVLVQESSLETMEILGTGAFGTVYKVLRKQPVCCHRIHYVAFQGTWLPEEVPEKLLVAIKVLNEGTGKAASKELLQEAVTTASMDHPHLVRLLCVCMASRVMLVTQLVPLGSLLSYLRKRKKTLTGEALLVFSQQIAKVRAVCLRFAFVV